MLEEGDQNIGGDRAAFCVTNQTRYLFTLVLTSGPIRIYFPGPEFFSAKSNSDSSPIFLQTGQAQSQLQASLFFQRQ
jgi:hypothetical protein